MELRCKQWDVMSGRKGVKSTKKKLHSSPVGRAAKAPLPLLLLSPVLLLPRWANKIERISSPVRKSICSINELEISQPVGRLTLYVLFLKEFVDFLSWIGCYPGETSYFLFCFARCCWICYCCIPSLLWPGIAFFLVTSIFFLIHFSGSRRTEALVLYSTFWRWSSTIRVRSVIRGIFYHLQPSRHLPTWV